MMSADDVETMERASRLRRLMNEYLKNMTPQERDRMMQVHLAEARGPIRNGNGLRMLTNTFIRARAAQRSQDRAGGERPDGGST